MTTRRLVVWCIIVAVTVALLLGISGQCSGQVLARCADTGEEWEAQAPLMPVLAEEVFLPLEPRTTRPRDWGLPSCPARRTAVRALRGDFGELAEWRRIGYTRILANGVRQQQAWITNYNERCPGVNRTTASGRNVETGRTAAMLHDSGRRLRRAEFGGFVLLEMPQGMELRQVWDTGSPANMRRARARGAETWVDRYTPGSRAGSWVRPIWTEVRG